jgi:hypothetical protein
MIKLILTSDDFYTNPELINEANGTAQPNVICEVSHEWYINNLDGLPPHREIIQDGDNELIINN